MNLFNKFFISIILVLFLASCNQGEDMTSSSKDGAGGTEGKEGKEGIKEDQSGDTDSSAATNPPGEKGKAESNYVSEGGNWGLFIPPEYEEEACKWFGNCKPGEYSLVQSWLCPDKNDKSAEAKELSWPLSWICPDKNDKSAEAKELSWPLSWICPDVEDGKIQSNKRFLQIKQQQQTYQKGLLLKTIKRQEKIPGFIGWDVLIETTSQ